MSGFKDKQGKLQPFWGFVFSLLLTALAFFVAGNIAYEAGDQRPFRIEFIFRMLWALLLLGIFIWMLTVADHVEDHRIAAQGLPRVRGWLKHLVLGFFLGGVLTCFVLAPMHFYGQIRAVNLMSAHLLPNLGALLLLMLVGALAEELVFRGYPFQHLVRAIGAVPAVLLLSLIYGVVHLRNPGADAWAIGNNVLIGILLSMACVRTRSLWLPWGIHVGWNFALGLVWGLPVSGFRVFALALYSQLYGPRWLTGGQYGPEASAAATVVFLLGIVLLWKLPLRELAQPTRPAEIQAPVRQTVSSI